MKLVNLPTPDTLKRHWQSLAMLDAILSPEWEYRYFSFDAHWSEVETLGSMRNGQGSAMRCLFTDSGAVLSGFDIEQKKSAFALRPSDLPAPLSAFANEPAFDNARTSFCLYQAANTREWMTVEASPKSKSADMLALVTMDASSYVKWALEYYEALVPVEEAQRIFAMEPMTGELAHAINPGATLREVRKEAKEIGYAVSAKTV